MKIALNIIFRNTHIRFSYKDCAVYLGTKAKSRYHNDMKGLNSNRGLRLAAMHEHTKNVGGYYISQTHSFLTTC